MESREPRPVADRLVSKLIESTRELGFSLAGVVDLDLAGEFISAHINRYNEWLEAGFAADMHYLERGKERRADPRSLMSDTQSILAVGFPYYRKQAGPTDSKIGPRYARYLQGRDYHAEIASRLEGALKKVKDDSFPDLQWKVCVDTSAVLERSWAAAAGIGWIGKNTLLIHPKFGSYFFVGVAFLNMPTGMRPSPMKNYCGNCERCLKACPTRAFEKAGFLNSNACISYWTLEKRKPFSENETRNTGAWVAGCDICQEVCPFNIKPAREEQLQPQESATSTQTWESLLSESSELYRVRIRNSALNRIKPSQFERNLAASLLNSVASNPHHDWANLLPLLEARIDACTDENVKSLFRGSLSLIYSPKCRL